MSRASKLLQAINESNKIKIVEGLMDEVVELIANNHSWQEAIAKVAVKHKRNYEDVIKDFTHASKGKTPEEVYHFINSNHEITLFNRLKYIQEALRPSK